MSVELRGVKDLLSNLDKYSEATQKRVADTIVMSAINVRTEAMRAMKSSPASGATYKRRSVTHTASSPGNAPRIDTGRLFNSIRWVASKTEAVVGVFGSMSLRGGIAGQSEGLSDANRSDYAAFLEFGTRNMQARPFLFPAFERERRVFVDKLTQMLRAAK